MGGIAVVIRSMKDRLFDGLVYAVLTLAMLACLFPLMYVISVSLTPFAEVLRHGGFVVIPRQVTFAAYRLFLGDTRIPKSYEVTAFVTMAGTAINLFLTILTAYPLSKRYLPGRGPLMMFFLLPMLFTGGLIPTYLIVKNAGLIDRIWAMIIPASIATYNVILMRTFFSNISEELYEAARIDGAGEMRVLVGIALPLSVPMIMTNALFYGVGHWNTFFDAILYITSSSLHPLQVVLRGILADTGQMQDVAEYTTPTETLKMAAVVLTALPIALVYPFIQKYFTKGMLLGAIKG
jgi:putative aldouronate transport system permease protein